MSDYRSVWRLEDAWGEIEVLDDGQQRVLAFGQGDEQSKQLKAKPFSPQHTYIQAMLLSLLFVQPRSALILGLGGGALLHALKKYDASIKLTAVELRSGVIDAATRFFQVQPSKKLQLIEDDALNFLQHGEHKKVDVIYADIYSVSGLDPQQLSDEFLQGAKRLLKANGLLVLNCWKEHKQQQAWLAQLKAEFNQVYGCLTGSGNWVVFVSQGDVRLHEQGLKEAALKLEHQFDCPMLRHLSGFEPWQ